MPRKYAGLTGDPKTRKVQHGNPSDWWERTFTTESEARKLETDMHAKGYEGSGGGQGWRYGYTYTITSATRQ